jgi:hypothetical protein
MGSRRNRSTYFVTGTFSLMVPASSEREAVQEAEKRLGTIEARSARVSFYPSHVTLEGTDAVKITSKHTAHIFIHKD